MGMINTNFGLGYAAIKTMNKNIKKLNKHNKNKISQTNSILYYQINEGIEFEKNNSVSNEIINQVKRMKKMNFNSNS